ncbi:MAG TPA: Uma2 family endonuclease [Longimicrobium sp.]|nr:Uma2 family endonuclease [Longimicrobium sp.]
MNIAPLGREATLEDLYAVEGNAELVDGRLVLMSPSGSAHNLAARNISHRLTEHEWENGGGRAYVDGAGFIASTRRTFSPDAAWYVGPDSGGRVVEGVPVLAVEVRSPDDYGPAAERRMAAKRADYFAEGTQVVWDVDVLREGWIRSYRASEPNHPSVFHRGEIADAEPAVSGWRFAVDDLFRTGKQASP